jgi:hypothetical protein
VDPSALTVPHVSHLPSLRPGPPTLPTCLFARLSVEPQPTCQSPISPLTPLTASWGPRISHHPCSPIFPSASPALAALPSSTRFTPALQHRLLDELTPPSCHRTLPQTHQVEHAGRFLSLATCRAATARMRHRYTATGRRDDQVEPLMTSACYRHLWQRLLLRAHLDAALFAHARIGHLRCYHLADMLPPCGLLGTASHHLTFWIAACDKAHCPTLTGATPSSVTPSLLFRLGAASA